MVDWVSDDEIYVAARLVREVFVAMLDDEWPSSGVPVNQMDGVDRDVELFVSIDPQKMADEYERVHKVALEIGAN